MDAYVTLPTLSLTAAQGQRLWGMDAPTCVYVLDSLVVDGLLTRTVDGQYCRADYARGSGLDVLGVAQGRLSAS